MTILAWDFGTSSVKAYLYDAASNLIGRGQQKLPTFHPKGGWVEQDASQIWALALPVAEEALEKAGRSWKAVTAIGITNQRETTILWDPDQGKALYPAIVWQDRRTAPLCEKLKKGDHTSFVREQTGLLLDPYFSATKIAWIADHVQLPKRTLFGTVDSWVIWNLTGRSAHVTDMTNASRTLLYAIREQKWSKELHELFGVPPSLELPEVKCSHADFGYTDPSLTGGQSIPILGVAGDQQAALYGQQGWEKGASKSTYGTGTFVMENIGETFVLSDKGLLTTIACGGQGKPCYALEGAIFYSGALFDWAVDALGIASSVAELDRLATKADPNHQVQVLPAHVGLGAPHWNSRIRGAITNLEASSGKEEIADACFQAVAFQTKEVLDLMQTESGCPIKRLKIDGGVTRSKRLSQMLADVLQIPVDVSNDTDLTARGVAYLAGLQPQPLEIETFTPKKELNYQLWKKTQNSLL